MKLHEKSYDNISCKERAAIQSLKRNKNIIIKPADKGGATLILNKSEYIKGKNQLNHQQNYQTLSLDTTKGPFPLRACKRAFFLSFIDLGLKRAQKKSIEQTKNALFHACSENGP